MRLSSNGINLNGPRPPPHRRELNPPSRQWRQLAMVPGLRGTRMASVNKDSFPMARALPPALPMSGRLNLPVCRVPMPRPCLEVALRL
jgi:hypothetical protein